MEIFCGALEHTDHQAGRIVESIEQTGELDNTLIIYIAGDNGPSPEGGLHGTLNKLSYFNGVAESLDEVAGHIDDFGGPVARRLSRRLGLRHRHAVHLRQGGDLGRRLQHRRRRPGRRASPTTAASAASSITTSTSPRPSWKASASLRRRASTAPTRSRWRA